MSAYHVGVRDVVLIPAEVERHGIGFHYKLRTPGTPTTGWFEAPNRGEPFDRALARDVLRALKGGAA